MHAPIYVYIHACYIYIYINLRIPIQIVFTYTCIHIHAYIYMHTPIQKMTRDNSPGIVCAEVVPYTYIRYIHAAVPDTYNSPGIVCAAVSDTYIRYIHAPVPVSYNSPGIICAAAVPETSPAPDQHMADLQQMCVIGAGNTCIHTWMRQHLTNIWPTCTKSVCSRLCIHAYTHVYESSVGHIYIYIYIYIYISK
jgi:hypothetical protein